MRACEREQVREREGVDNFGGSKRERKEKRVWEDETGCHPWHNGSHFAHAHTVRASEDTSTHSQKLGLSYFHIVHMISS